MEKSYSRAQTGFGKKKKHQTQEIPIIFLFQPKVDQTLEVKLLKEQLQAAVDCHEVNKKLNIEIKRYVQVLKENQKNLIEEKTKNEEFKKEIQERIEKFQQAMKIAEDAVLEVETLSEENLCMKNECDSLATTVRSVIEKASADVELNFKKLETKLRLENDEALRVSSQKIAAQEDELKSLRQEKDSLVDTLEELRTTIVSVSM
jgi:chromosome segregation ATPase